MYYNNKWIAGVTFIKLTSFCNFILHIKTFYKLLPFYVKETKNITGKLKAGNKFLKH